jgi:hypothetical protein
LTQIKCQELEAIILYRSPGSPSSNAAIHALPNLPQPGSGHIDAGKPGDGGLVA